MRITGGSARGITLKVPKGSDTRPATDQMRQAVFSSLGDRVVGAACLDLYAGTGAYGLEALSRGAGSCVFVEKDRRAVQCLRDNLAAVGKSMLSGGGGDGRGTVVQSDVTGLPVARYLGVDLVFIDAPYALVAHSVPVLLAHIAAVAEADRMRWIVVEAPGNYQLQHPHYEIIARLGKGQHQPTVYILQSLCAKENQS